MSQRRSHPPHSRARTTEAGLIAVAVMAVALVISVVTSAAAAPSGRHHPSAKGLSVLNAAASAAQTAVIDAAPAAPPSNEQVAWEFRQHEHAFEQFLNTLAWDGAVTRTIAFEDAVARAEAARPAPPAAGPSIAYGGGLDASSSVEATFACIRNAESGNNYSAVNSNSGAGGAYQFMPSTWASLGGAGLPEDAPPAEQDAMALKLYDRDGWSPWAGDSCV